MIAMHYFPTAPFGTAFGVPTDEAVERILASARELSAAAEKTPKGEGFGQRLMKAVQARVGSTMRPRIGVLANAAVAPKAEDESFAERFKRLCEEKAGVKRRKEQTERERSRYTHQPRKPSKGE